MQSRFSLYNIPQYVPDFFSIAGRIPIISGVKKVSFGRQVLDHLAADGAGLTGGQVAVVAVGQVDTHFPWCTYYIVNSPDKSVSTGLEAPGTNSRTGSFTISPMNL